MARDCATDLWRALKPTKEGLRPVQAIDEGRKDVATLAARCVVSAHVCVLSDHSSTIDF